MNSPLVPLDVEKIQGIEWQEFQYNNKLKIFQIIFTKIVHIYQINDYTRYGDIGHNIMLLQFQI